MVFNNIDMPFWSIIVAKDGFESWNDRLVAGYTVKGIGELVIRGEEKMKLPRPRERKMGDICLGVSEFIEGIAIVGFHQDNVNRREQEERMACNTHHSLELTHFCLGLVWCKWEIEKSLECVSMQL